MRNLFFWIISIICIGSIGWAENNIGDDVTQLKAEIARLQAEIKQTKNIAEILLQINEDLLQVLEDNSVVSAETNYLIQSSQKRVMDAEKNLFILELEVVRLKEIEEDYEELISENTKLKQNLNTLENFKQEYIKSLTRVQKSEERKRWDLEKLLSQKTTVDVDLLLMQNENKILKEQLGQAREDLVELKLEQQNQAKSTKKGPQLSSKMLETSFNLQTRDVRMSLQAVLRARGFYKSSLDGVWGKGTNAALLQFAESVDMMNASPVKVMNAAMAGMNIYYSDESRGRRVPSSNSKRGNSSELVAIVNNPSASASQAKSICRGEAANAASAYSRSLPPTNFDADCDTRGSNNISCTGSFSRSGGFWGGATDALQEANVRNRTYRSCLARYGWAEK